MILPSKKHKLLFNFQIVIVCFVFSFSIYCNSKKTKAFKRDTSINAQSSYNNVFLDSQHVENFILGEDSLLKYHDELVSFYTQRNFEYAWFDANGMTEQAHNFYNLQNNLINSLEDSTLYNPELRKKYEWLLDNTDTKSKGYDSIISRAEMIMTAQFFKYAAKVYHGSNINAQDLGWFIPRKKINISELLDSLVDGKKRPQNEYEPLNKQYRLLEKSVAKYYLLKKKGGWLPLTAPLVWKIGEMNATIPAIKNRLYLLGDYPKQDTVSTIDNTLDMAIKQFQRRFGLAENGIVDAKTLKTLNIPLDVLIQKILVNMERARWMPTDTSKIDRVIVNIPEYKLRVYDAGKLSSTMPVVVGTAAHNTVIFNGNIQYIVFSPYWNVPTSITKNEVMPAMQRNHNYLRNNNMEIVQTIGGIPEVRQKPGGNNALGKVKFLFPNKYDIYLHDTPNKDVFLDAKRGFSHGCIRVGNPKGLAIFLLRNQPNYTIDSIQKLMDNGQEKWVTIKPLVPVTIKYFTAWVEEDGLLFFRDDIYGNDKKMVQKLFYE
jgi:murein L,D-transpeptidase YcbB/YkuD